MLDLPGGHADRVFPARFALGQRPFAREQLLEPLVRGCEDGLVGVGRPYAVAPSTSSAYAPDSPASTPAKVRSPTT
jgi:hypothetical protein